jgi:hypothetical protein
VTLEPPPLPHPWSSKHTKNAARERRQILVGTVTSNSFVNHRCEQPLGRRETADCSRSMGWSDPEP